MTELRKMSVWVFIIGMCALTLTGCAGNAEQDAQAQDEDSETDEAEDTITPSETRQIVLQEEKPEETYGAEEENDKNESMESEEPTPETLDVEDDNQDGNTGTEEAAKDIVSVHDVEEDSDEDLINAEIDSGITDSGSCGENLVWDLDSEGTLTISGTGNMDNFFNSGSDAPWSAYMGSVQSAVIESGVTSIGTRSFEDAINLTSVSLPNTVTLINESAFSGCSSLKEINFPESLTVISNFAFYNCTDLADITIPAGVEGIGQFAFRGCTGLNSITFSGNAPLLCPYCFGEVTAIAYYPAENTSWTAEVMQGDHRGNLTWIVY